MTFSTSSKFCKSFFKYIVKFRIDKGCGNLFKLCFSLRRATWLNTYNSMLTRTSSDLDILFAKFEHVKSVKI